MLGLWVDAFEDFEIALKTRNVAFVLPDIIGTVSKRAKIYIIASSYRAEKLMAIIPTIEPELNGKWEVISAEEFDCRELKDEKACAKLPDHAKQSLKAKEEL